MVGNNLWEIVKNTISHYILYQKEEGMRFRILSILMALVLCIGTVSAMSSIEYNVQADNAVVDVDMTYQNILENETVVGSLSMSLDYMNIDTAGVILEDDTGIVLNNTLRAVPVQSRMISSGTMMQNFASAVRMNNSYDFAVSGFKVDGRGMNLVSDVQAETASLSHIVKGQVAGDVSMGLITQSPTNRFENIVRSRAVRQNITMNANWQTYQPAVEIEVPSVDISSLCVWAAQSSYPIFPISA